MGSARDSPVFKVEFYATKFGQEYLVSSDTTNAYIVGSTLKPNSISDITATAKDSSYVSTQTAITLTFTPSSLLPGAN